MRGYRALVWRELKKWSTQPLMLFLGIVQPVIWMALFGKVFNPGALADPSTFEATFGTPDYFSYMAVGMPAFVVLFTSVFSGMGIVWDRRLGFLGKVLSTPTHRASVVLAKMTSTVVRSLAQATVIVLLAVALGATFGPDRHWAAVPLVLLGLVLMGLGLAALFVAIAVRSTKWETQMAVVNLLNLPLLFASNTLYPAKLMPAWMRPIAAVNPVSHMSDLARQLLLWDTDWSAVAADLVFLGSFAALFAGVGVWVSWRYLSK